MIDSSLVPTRLANLDDDRENFRAIVFALANIEQTPMGKYLFALPVEAVAKAIVYPAERPPLNDGIGMIVIGEQTVTIADLRHKFAAIAPETDASGFLLLFHTHANELCGLPIKDAPVLMDIALSTVRPLPLAYREVNHLSFASHMALIAQGENVEPLQILLLGMARSVDLALN